MCHRVKSMYCIGCRWNYKHWSHKFPKGQRTVTKRRLHFFVHFVKVLKLSTRASLYPVSASMKSQCCYYTFDIAVIEKNGVSPKWVEIPFGSDSICFHWFQWERHYSVDSALTLTLGVNGSLCSSILHLSTTTLLLIFFSCVRTRSASTFQNLTWWSALIAMVTECVTLLDSVTVMLGTHLLIATRAGEVVVSTADLLTRAKVSTSAWFSLS